MIAGAGFRAILIDTMTGRGEVAGAEMTTIDVTMTIGAMTTIDVRTIDEKSPKVPEQR
jgi:hypothetical protein